MASNLPPGCTVRDIERAFGEEGPCGVCGQSVDDCICPECPVCDAQGDPFCYDHHGLVRSFGQVALFAEAEARAIEDAAAEDAYYRAIEENERAAREYFGT
jgi:hypothetical protein